MVAINHRVSAPDVRAGGYGSYTGPEPKQTGLRECLVTLRMGQRGSGESTVGLPTDSGELLRLTMGADRK